MSAPQSLVEQALRLARLPCVAYVTERAETNIRWARNSLTTNGEMRSRDLTVLATAEVAGGTAVGTVSRQISGAGDVPAVVDAAEEAARRAPPSPDASPLVEDYCPGDAWDEPAELTSIDALRDTTAALGRAFAAADRARHRLYGFAEHVLTTTFLGSTTGLRRRGVQPIGRLELSGRAEDGANSAWVGAPTRTFTDVDVSALHDQLGTRLGWGANRVDLAPGSYETLLPSGVMADLMIFALRRASAREAEEGRNVYGATDGRTKIGQRLAQLPVTLRTDPSHPGIETVPFVDYASSTDGTSWSFDAGLPVSAVDWIRDGMLTELVRNRAWAAKTERSATAPAANVIMEGGGTATLADMVSGTERGLLLTCLWYIREVEAKRLLLTGLTRDGVYLVQDGQVVAAVNNFRFNESPIELLGRINEVGVAQRVLSRERSDWFTAAVMPPVRVPDFTMSTVSPAS